MSSTRNLRWRLTKRSRALSRRARARLTCSTRPTSRHGPRKVDCFLSFASHFPERAHACPLVLLGPFDATPTHEQVAGPETPAQPVRKAPLTPPATPRRSGRHASAQKATSYSSSSTLATLSDESYSTANNRYATPPQLNESVFSSSSEEFPRHQEVASVVTPPSPVTPGTRRRRSSLVTPPRSHRRKPSADSSSSSSGNSSSQPPTPTGPLSFAQAQAASTTSSLSFNLGNAVRIAGTDEHRLLTSRLEDTLNFSHSSVADDASSLGYAASASQSSNGSKASYTAYYPLLADWADAASSQQASYNVVSLPPPVILPATKVDGNDLQWPAPPSHVEAPAAPAPGYYSREEKKPVRRRLFARASPRVH